jgi:hypothetical protein
MSGPIKPVIDDPQTYEIIGAAIAVHPVRLYGSPTVMQRR